MTTKKITYSFKSINLYGFEDINFEDSLNNILTEFKTLFEYKLKKTLNCLGLKYIALKTFSPKTYNYDGDSIDLIIRVINKNKFKSYILKNKDLLNTELSKNKSYSGYIALSVYDINEELNNIKKSDYEPDILILITLLNKYIEDLKNFNYMDYLIFEDSEED